MTFHISQKKQRIYHCKSQSKNTSKKLTFDLDFVQSVILMYIHSTASNQTSPRKKSLDFVVILHLMLQKRALNDAILYLDPGKQDFGIQTMLFYKFMKYEFFGNFPLGTNYDTVILH